ncbi:hypothetical protein GCM10020218_054750 [Dactylosporangium vinaceum]|uniref:Uncharacterized protein n=1 Tax=Dactylosporangium vinaceum TaxID=53362 RepID=A0ABV5MH96_9ACTN
MVTSVVERPALHRPVSSERRDLLVALAAVWLTAGLFMDGWAHSHVPDLETFFTPWHAILYSGYAALAVSLTRPECGVAAPREPWRRGFRPATGWGCSARSCSRSPAPAT